MKIEAMPVFDVTGIGLNATDTIILVDRFPAYAGKEAYREEILSPGGQVATAMAACARLGLRTAYVGAVGDDERGRIQMDSLRGCGLHIDDVIVRAGCPNQSAYIIVDRATGERTVFWRHPECLRMRPEELRPEAVTSSRLLHVDCCDTALAARAAAIARAASIPVTADLDTVYPGLDRVLPNVDYLIASSEFPGHWTGEQDPFRALERIQNEYGMRVAAMTLGSAGALALCGGQFVYAPAFAVDCVDTTGAGDVFHGAFCYAVLQEMTIEVALEFSCAMAALNCTALGARGHIAGAPEIRRFMARAERRSKLEFLLRTPAR